MTMIIFVLYCPYELPILHSVRTCLQVLQIWECITGTRIHIRLPYSSQTAFIIALALPDCSKELCSIHAKTTQSASFNYFLKDHNQLCKVVPIYSWSKQTSRLQTPEEAWLIQILHTVRWKTNTSLQSTLSIYKRSIQHLQRPLARRRCTAVAKACLSLDQQQHCHVWCPCSSAI